MSYNYDIVEEDVKDGDNDTADLGSTPTTQCLNQTQEGATASASPDAFLYIVVVLSFYALAMTILMIKYIRRENQEAQLSYYFQEFINRDKFHTAQYENKQGLRAVKRTLTKVYRSMGLVEAEKYSPCHVAVVDDRPPDKMCREQFDGSDSGVSSDRACKDGSLATLPNSDSNIDVSRSDDELLSPGRDTDSREKDLQTELLPQLSIIESLV